MKILIEFDYDVEGECSDVEKVFLENLPLVGSIIISEDVDGTDDWAITINDYEIIEASK